MTSHNDNFDLYVVWSFLTTTATHTRSYREYSILIRYGEYTFQVPRILGLRSSTENLIDRILSFIFNLDPLFHPYHHS